MKELRRFFIPKIELDKKIFFLDKGQSHHIKHVLRMNFGDSVLLFDAFGKEIIAIIQEYHEKQIKLAKTDIFFTPKSEAPNIWLAVAACKRKKMDMIVEKATEIGITGLAFFNSQRSSPKLSSNTKEKQILRWRKITIEAAKQCKGILPDIKIFKEINEMFDYFSSYDIKIICEPLIKTIDGPCFADKKSNTVALIGPAGGFEKMEKKKQNLKVLSPLEYLIISFVRKLRQFAWQGYYPAFF